MNHRNLLRTLAFACGASLAIPAHAITFSGSFSGIAEAVWLAIGEDPLRPSAPYDGAPVSGRFSVHVDDAHLSAGEVGQYVDYGPGGSMLLTYDVAGRHFEFPSVPWNEGQVGFMLAFGPTPGDPSQAMSFHDAFYLRFHGAEFSVTSAAGNLFRGNDLGTLRVAADTVSAFATSFSDAATGIHVDVDITSFRFDTLAAPVPEAPMGALMLGGLLTLGVASRRRPPTAAHQASALCTAARSVPSCTATVTEMSRP